MVPNLQRAPVCLCLLVLFCLFGWGCHGGKILVAPVEGSHWVNMDILIRALHEHGHSITVVRTTKSWYIKEDSSYYHAITVPVEKAFDEEFVKPIILQLMEVERGVSSMLHFIPLQFVLFSAMYKAHDITCHLASKMLGDRPLMRQLNESQFDLVLTDPSFADGVLLAHYLKVPMVYNVRWVLTREGHQTLAPSPLSHIPITGSGLTDRMTFLQRVKNVLFHFLTLSQYHFMIQGQYQEICDKYFQPKVNFQDLLFSADIWLMRVDFVFEFPRPTMPNVVYMGGFQCKPAKPLPQDLEDFVQSSGDHGVIIMSLGTLVGQLPSDLAEAIAAAFAVLPQKVIWRYTGDQPSTVANNTRLVKWLPQNDLLGHRKVKLFVSHGGTNGIQEAIYHGVPMVGIPLVFDQADNLSKMLARRVAVVVDIASLQKDTFLQALKEVLHEPSYRENMQRLSRLHRDTPMKPLDSAIFWIEFVMRHKGAAHLRTESYKMPWYSYHSVDVMLFLFAALNTFILLFIFIIKCMCNRICIAKHKSKPE